METGENSMEAIGRIVDRIVARALAGAADRGVTDGAVAAGSMRNGSDKRHPATGSLGTPPGGVLGGTSKKPDDAPAGEGDGPKAGAMGKPAPERTTTEAAARPRNEETADLTDFTVTGLPAGLCCRTSGRLWGMTGEVAV